MKRFPLIALLAGVLAGWLALGVPWAAAEEEEEDEATIGGRLQMFGFAQSLDEKFGNDQRLYLYARQARVQVSGTQEGMQYFLQMAFGGEEEVKAPNPGVSLNLLDFSVEIPVGPAKLRLGQFKVPYGRERLTDTGRMLFADRSITDLAFRVGRDVGGAIWTRSGNLTLIGGVFTGGGRDIPIRYLPQELGVPMVVVRAGLDTGVDEDPFALSQGESELEATGVALYANALYLRDSRLAHATVMGVKLADKSLLINSNWNPFIGQQPRSLGTLLQLGADAALRMPLANGMVLSAEGEVNYGRYSNDHGEIALTGLRVQGGVHQGALGLALRYSVILPDENLAAGGTPITGTDPIHEIVPAISYALRGDHRVKVTLDLPVLLDVPVVVEEGVGTYITTEQPDQVSYLVPNEQGVARGTIERQNVIEGRLLFQFSF